MTSSRPAPPIARLGLIGLAWLSIAGAAIYDFGLYVQNILAYPYNVGVSEWWGSELAIRYCAGFVRRGLLGQTSWLLTQLVDQQSAYVAALAALMAASVLVLGFIFYRSLRIKLALLPSLLILSAPTAMPVMLTHAGSLFRKDAFQLCLFALILFLVHHFDVASSARRKTFLYGLAAVVQVAAVFNHEPFALLITPALFLARLLSRKGYLKSFLLVMPSVAAFLLAVLNKGRLEDVNCLQASLRSVQLLPLNARPGSSITELALTKPSFFTWDLSLGQLGWSLLHGFLAVCITWACYVLILRQISHRVLPSRKAGSFLFSQILIALPLFMATIDYGRWFAMLACAGMLSLLSIPKNEVASAQQISLADLEKFGMANHWPLVILAVAALVVIPSHCCTYQSSHIFASVSYAGLSIWKHILLS
ncbi:hypothetical protein [Synechococcus sp. LTW-R]|uniref:hypothetical protein n=1 Tax=Synechococcus sp. LTW-R TaxID=2751170 RepID=UPI0016247C3F|nr:hypothetical protein [Synechococcus sp. LTW-R]QNG28985.1 hypothetical protein H0O22_09560 [Synechococcus sp. LTW-R]